MLGPFAKVVQFLYYLACQANFQSYCVAGGYDWINHNFLGSGPSWKPTFDICFLSPSSLSVIYDKPMFWFSSALNASLDQPDLFLDNVFASSYPLDSDEPLCGSVPSETGTTSPIDTPSIFNDTSNVVETSYLWNTITTSLPIQPSPLSVRALPSPAKRLSQTVRKVHLSTSTLLLPVTARRSPSPNNSPLSVGLSPQSIYGREPPCMSRTGPYPTRFLASSHSSDTPAPSPLVRPLDLLNGAHVDDPIVVKDFLPLNGVTGLWLLALILGLTVSWLLVKVFFLARYLYKLHADSAIHLESLKETSTKLELVSAEKTACQRERDQAREQALSWEKQFYDLTSMHSEEAKQVNEEKDAAVIRAKEADEALILQQQEATVLLDSKSKDCQQAALQTKHALDQKSKEEKKSKELQRQLSSAQSKFAKKENQVIQLQIKNADLQTRTQELGDEKTRLKDQTTTLKATQDAKLKELADKASQASQVHDDRANTVLVKTSRIAELEKNEKQSEEVISNLRRDNKDLKAQQGFLGNVKAAKDLVQGEVDALTRKNNALVEVNQTLKQQLEEDHAQNAMMTAELSENHDALKLVNSNLVQENEALKHDLDDARDKEVSQAAKADALAQELAAETQVRKDIQTVRQSLRREVDDASQDLEKAHTKQTALDAEVADLAKQLEVESEKVNDLQAENQILQARLLDVRQALVESKETEEDLKTELVFARDISETADEQVHANGQVIADKQPEIVDEIDSEERSSPQDDSEELSEEYSEYLMSPVAASSSIETTKILPQYHGLKFHPLSPQFEAFVSPPASLFRPRVSSSPHMIDTTALKAFMALISTHQVPKIMGRILSSVKVSDDPSRTFEKYLRGTSIPRRHARERLRKSVDYMKKLGELRLREFCEPEDNVLTKVAWARDLKSLCPILRSGRDLPRRHSLTYGDREAVPEEIDAHRLRIHAVRQLRRKASFEYRNSAKNILLAIEGRSFTASSSADFKSDFESMPLDLRRIFFDDFFEARQMISSDDSFLDGLRIADIHSIDNAITNIRLDQAHLNTPLAGHYPYDPARSMWTKPEVRVAPWQEALPTYMADNPPFDFAMPPNRAAILGSEPQRQLTRSLVSGTTRVSPVVFMRDLFIYHGVPEIENMHNLDLAFVPKYTIGSKRGVTSAYVCHDMDRHEFRPLRPLHDSQTRTDDEPVDPPPFRDHKSAENGFLYIWSFPMMELDGGVGDMKGVENPLLGMVPVWKKMEETRSRDEDDVVEMPVDPKVVKPRVFMNRADVAEVEIDEAEEEEVLEEDERTRDEDDVAEMPVDPKFVKPIICMNIEEKTGEGEVEEKREVVKNKTMCDLSMSMWAS